MTPAVLPECLEMDKEWYRRSREREGAAQAGDLGNEGLALRDAIAHFEELGLEGGVIRAMERWLPLPWETGWGGTAMTSALRRPITSCGAAIP